MEFVPCIIGYLNEDTPVYEDDVECYVRIKGRNVPVDKQFLRSREANFKPHPKGRWFLEKTI